MPGKLTRLWLLCGLLWVSGATPAFAASELQTLFTTPQERQLINANRYKRDEVKPQQQVTVDRADESPVQILVREEVSVDYRVSGISLATDGAHTAWINDIAYEDGARLEDGSRIKIYAGDDIRVRITAPDGKQYFATSGETLTVTYMAAVEN
jgi:hypothetical protein